MAERCLRLCDRPLNLTLWQVEVDYLPLYKEYGIGLTTWSPLYFGLLTGKYAHDSKPQDGRLMKQGGYNQVGGEPGCRCIIHNVLW